MTSPQFVRWLEGKIAQYHTGKVIPPKIVLRQKFLTEAERQIRDVELRAMILEHDLHGKVQRRMNTLLPKLESVDLEREVKELLGVSPEQQWDQPLSEVATQTIGTNGNGKK